jgi:hypothetical protein
MPMVCPSPPGYYFCQSLDSIAVRRLYIQLLVDGKRLARAYIRLCIDFCWFSPLEVWQAPGPVRNSLGHPFDFAQGRLLGSVWAFFNYMGGVKDLRWKTRLVTWEGKSESQRTQRKRESTEGSEDYFLGTVRGISRVPILLEAGSRMPMRRKSWPEGRSSCWKKRKGP